MENYLVSIITPSYNSTRFISATIKSIVSQNYSNWELLIIDDCSCDNTLSIVKRFEKQDQRIHVYKLHTNSGPAIARNMGIKKALL
jgi:glycosyltransferase involved in cell wall biosynthesis